MPYVVNKKAQLKIQEMAFVLVAIVIFFALIALVFFSIKLNSIKKQAGLVQEEQAASLVRQISGIPELSWSCSSCIDFDKAMALSLSDKNALSSFLELDYLKIELLYPQSNNQSCVLGSYPNCKNLLLINTTTNFGIVSSAFVNLCRWDSEKQQNICELGKVYASGAGVKKDETK